MCYTLNDTVKNEINCLCVNTTPIVNDDSKKTKQQTDYFTNK